MNIILHGTGAGTPSGNRGASAATVAFEDGSLLLIDAGEGCCRGMIRDGRELNDVTSVVISHMHADHWAGLPNLVMAWIISKREKPVDLYLPPRSLNFFRSLLTASLLLVNRLPFELRMVELKSFPLPGEWTLRPFRTSHLDKYAEVIEAQSLSFPSFGFVLEREGKKIIFSQDLGSEKDLHEELSGTDILICEAAHVDLAQAIEDACDTGISRLVFTHIPSDREEALQGFENEERIGLSIAEDGLMIPLQDF